MKLTTLGLESLDETQRRLRADRTPFAVATVVRTWEATSAKPGSKADSASDNPRRSRDDQAPAHGERRPRRPEPKSDGQSDSPFGSDGPTPAFLLRPTRVV